MTCGCYFVGRAGGRGECGEFVGGIAMAESVSSQAGAVAAYLPTSWVLAQTISNYVSNSMQFALSVTMLY